MAEMQERNTGMIEESDEGHSIYFILPVVDFTNMQSCPLKLNGKTNCSILPTSWALEVVYEHQEDSFEFFLCINLIRMDHRKHSKRVQVFLFLSCLDANNRLVRFSQELLRGFFGDGDALQGCVRESRCLVSALKVTVLVKCCNKTK
ncbi:hypothetical protein HNY73_010694 [Argiope bruennichi]|uniref:Uncharacterized protein n=1 Tax=Argiope bruennichi TaxID=94029 RepID=A0A8T0F1W2_ARGBR|nr:hypothetical protein HNY73_010694 [Argiope bruennichi]